LNTTEKKNAEDDHPLLRRYVSYLRDDCGLARNSVLVYRPYVRNLLAEQVARTGRVCVDAFNASTIRKYLLDHVRGRSGEYARLMATSLRSFFRFLFLCGDLPRDLSTSVPAVSKPRPLAAPAFLSREEIDRVILATDGSTLTRRRDRAVLLLLARLGLRAGEIVQLELEDIRWRTGEIIIHGKGRLIEPLPLLKEVGEALVRYLRDVPRSCDCRRVFRRVNVPFQGFAGPAAVGHIVRAALARAGIRRSGRGAAHLFRHGLATEMVRSGATLTEISEVLRHRSLRTTAVYTHVSFEALRAVATQWPDTGGVQ
jgi:integrase/recombinase XerD